MDIVYIYVVHISTYMYMCIERERDARLARASHQRQKVHGIYRYFTNLDINM